VPKWHDNWCVRDDLGIERVKGIQASEPPAINKAAPQQLHSRNLLRGMPLLLISSQSSTDMVSYMHNIAVRKKGSTLAHCKCSRRFTSAEPV